METLILIGEELILVDKETLDEINKILEDNTLIKTDFSSISELFEEYPVVTMYNVDFICELLDKNKLTLFWNSGQRFKVHAKKYAQWNNYSIVIQYRSNVGRWFCTRNSHSNLKPTNRLITTNKHKNFYSSKKTN